MASLGSAEEEDRGGNASLQLAIAGRWILAQAVSEDEDDESLVGVTDLTVKARLVVRHCETGVLRSAPGSYWRLLARHGGAGFGKVKLPDG